MGLAARKETEKYTYADYLKWDDGKRWELINGEAYDMSPAPRPVHQEILGELFLQLRTKLKGKSCKVYMAPYDVRLPFKDKREDDILDVVQPDLTVICDPKKRDDKGCLGAPDFIIEILSPGNHRHDRVKKYNLYEMAGVKEYWMVSPEERLVEVLRLGADGAYGRMTVYTETDVVPIGVLKEMEIDLNTVFLEIES